MLRRGFVRYRPQHAGRRRKNVLIATRTGNTLAFHNRTSGNGFPEQWWIDDGNAMIGKSSVIAR